MMSEPLDMDETVSGNTTTEITHSWIKTEDGAQLDRFVHEVSSMWVMNLAFDHILP